MSRYMSEKHSTLSPYIPGEQPRDRKYIKLNTNESPFAPSESVRRAVTEESEALMLYSDPDSAELIKKMSEVYGLPSDMIVMGNGSDEIIGFAIQAFCDESRPIAAPEITYSFYPVVASLLNIPYKTVPLKEDFSIDTDSFVGIGCNVIFANPNAPTGKVVDRADIEKIAASNPDNVVIVDEAYIAFGAQSCRNLVNKYPNILVTGTFSKSHSLAGARLGFCFGSRELISDINTVRNSFNPYNVNRITQRAGIAALEDNEFYLNNCRIVAANREWTAEKLTELGFTVIPSMANFLFVSSPDIGGEALYRTLKERGILVRHFSSDLLTDWIRVSIGTIDQMEYFIEVVSSITKGGAR